MASEAQKNTLTSKEICNIIRACSKSGLVKLSFDGLHLEFGENAKETIGIKPTQQVLMAPEAEQLSMPLDGESSADLEMTDEVLQMHLATSDPALWEKMQLEGTDYAEETEHN